MAFGKSTSSRGGAGYSIEVDDADMRGVLRRLRAGTARQIIQRSLNHALAKANTVAKRTLAARRNIKAGDAAKQLRMIRATNTVLEASIRASGRPINLYDTKGTKTQTRQGVKANPGTGKKLFPGAFIAKMPSGHVGIFERVARKGQRRYEKRRKDGRKWLSELPIREIRLPSLSTTLVQTDVTKALDLVALPAYDRELARLITRELAKKGK